MAELDPGDPPEILIHARDQQLQGVGIAFSIFDEELGDVASFRHLENSRSLNYSASPLPFGQAGFVHASRLPK